LSDLHDLDGDEEAQRDRYRELLEELRTVLPGVQVLLAFLLTVPFTERFGEVDDLGRNVFAGVIVGVALTIVTFLTPAAYHRVGDRHDRAERLRTSARLAVTGLCLLGASMVAVLFVVVRFVFDSTVLGLAFGATLGLAVGALWFFLPVRRAHRVAARRTSPSAGDGD
jgi:O-antigen/teichoic acid export membrane protein